MITSSEGEHFRPAGSPSSAIKERIRPRDVTQVERESNVNSTAIMGKLDLVSEFSRLEVSVPPFFGVPLC